MSSQPKLKKRSYSSVYKIYRRCRFLRHQKRAIRKIRMEIRRNEAAEQAEIESKLKEFRKSEREQKHLERKANREESKRLRKEFAVEFRERKIQSGLEFKQLKLEERERARLSHKQDKKDRRRLLKYYFKSRFTSLLRSYRLLGPANLQKQWRNLRQGAPNRKTFSIISFNSTILFLLSYFFLYLLNMATTVIAASLFDYPTIVYYYEIYYNISPEEWYPDSVKIIFSAGPLVNLVIGISFLIIYNKLRESAISFKLFFLWGFMHAINMFFGAMLVGTLFETGVGHVISWMYIMDTGRMLYSIVSLFILVVSGLIATKPILFSGNCYFNKIDRQNRSLFINGQILAPYILGNAALIIIRQPRFIVYDTFIALTLIIMIIPVIATYKAYNDLYFEEDKKKPGITWLSLVILALVILFFRGILEVGVRFGG